MKLYFLRHGTAEDLNKKSPQDSDRELTHEGLREAKAAGDALKKLGTVLEAVYSSPYVRAKQTAFQAAESAGYPGKNIRFRQELVPGASFHDFLKILREISPDKKGGYLVVGHEPSISAFISALLCGDESAVAVRMKKASLCRLELSGDLNRFSAELQWLLTPGQLARIASS